MSSIYRVVQKLAHFCTSHNFIKYWPILKPFFTIRIRIKFVIILSLKILQHLECIATLSCEINQSINHYFSVCLNVEQRAGQLSLSHVGITEICQCFKATLENKTSVTTRFKLTTGNNVFIVSLITVTSCSFYVKCSMCPSCCWTTHS